MVVQISSYINQEIPIPKKGYAVLSTKIADKIQFIAKLSELNARLNESYNLIHYNKKEAVYDITIRIDLDNRSFLNLFLKGTKSVNHKCYVTTENIQLVIFPKMCIKLKNDTGKNQYISYCQSFPNVSDISLCDEYKEIQQAVHVIPIDQLYTFTIETFSKPEKISSDTTNYINRFLFYGGPPMNMVLMNVNQTIFDSDQLSMTDFFIKKVKEQIQSKRPIIKYMEKIPVCKFINNTKSISLVVVPESDTSKIFGCACFEHIPLATKENRMNAVSIHEHVQIKWFSVDTVCDDSARIPEDAENKNELQFGIKYQFFAAAYNYILKQWGELPMIYTGDDHVLKYFLKEEGFNTEKSMTNESILMKSILPARCNTWDECLQLVRDRFPEKPLSARLKLASIYYTNKKSVDRKHQMHTRSHLPVSLETGAQILRDYYYEKFITSVFDSETHPLWDDMSSIQQDRYKMAVDHIRGHLLRTKVRPIDKTVKTNGIESYKFRPNPNKKLSPFTSAEGPELYYLDVLDANEPLYGSKLFSHPFSIDTPEQLVWHESPSNWKKSKASSWKRKAVRLTREY